MNKLINPFLADPMQKRVIEQHELTLLLHLSVKSLRLYLYILMVKIPQREGYFELRDIEIHELFVSYRAFKEATKDLIRFNIIDIKSDTLNQYWINYKFFTQYGYYHTIGDVTIS